MDIRQKNNPFKTMPLPQNAVWTEQGWHIPIFSEIPDDLFITYLNQDWELVVKDTKMPVRESAQEVAIQLLRDL